MSSQLAWTKFHARGWPTALLLIKIMVEMVSCLRILSGSRLYCKYLNHKHHEDKGHMWWSPAGDQHHWPVEQPWRLGAGHGVKEFIFLWSQGGVLEHGPSKVPLLYSSWCNRITVDYGLQVGNDPGTIDNQFNDKRCKRNDKRQRHKSSVLNTCYYRGFSSTLWTIQWSYLYSLLLRRCKLTRWRSPGCTCRGMSEEH